MKKDQSEYQTVEVDITIQSSAEVDPALLRMLDRGIEDIENGRVLPHAEAMDEIKNIREQRRRARLGISKVAHGTV